MSWVRCPATLRRGGRGSGSAYVFRRADGVWTPEATRQQAQVGEYIARLCGQVRDVYFHPPAQPTEGEESNGWWVRRKHVFYDTDMLREGQTEAWRLCGQQAADK